MSLAGALALVASTVFLLRLLPQPVRLRRTGVAAGVSPMAAANAVSSATAWLAYGVTRDLVAVWVVSIAALVPGIWTLWLLRREFTRVDVVGSAGVASAFVLSGAAGVLGAALALGVLVTSGPQVVRAIRHSDLHGISPATWWVAIADASSWGAYGLVIGNRALQGYGVVLSVSAVIVIGRIWWTSRTPALVGLPRDCRSATLSPK